MNKIKIKQNVKQRKKTILRSKKGHLKDDALVEDSQAKKTKQATQWAMSVFTGWCQLR